MYSMKATAFMWPHAWQSTAETGEASIATLAGDGTFLKIFQAEQGTISCSNDFPIQNHFNAKVKMKLPF